MRDQRYNRVDVTDREGWRKEYTLSKAILHIGSDPRNDIVLEGGRGQGVEPRHAQLIAAPGSRGYRLVNLGSGQILLSSLNGRTLPPRGAVDVFDGDQIQIGEYQLVFFAGAGLSNAIALRLRLPDSELTPDATLEGLITVQNMGEVPGVQFKLSVEGLSPDWYDIGPGPILFPGAQKDVLFKLRHPRQPHPPAGGHVITVRATASEAYPGESAAVSQTVRIAPFFRHRIRLTPSDD
jgi:hypothetical protein